MFSRSLMVCLPMTTKKRKGREFKKPDIIETEVFADEYGAIWSFASPNHDKCYAAVTLKRTDYQRLLRAAKRGTPND